MNDDPHLSCSGQNPGVILDSSSLQHSIINLSANHLGLPSKHIQNLTTSQHLLWYYLSLIWIVVLLRDFTFFFFFKFFFILREGEGKEKKREKSINVREKHQLVDSECAPTRTEPATRMYPDWESNQQPFGF